MLDTDDVTRMRLLPSVGTSRRYGTKVKIFLQLLHSDPFVKHWYHDVEGYKLCTLRYPIMQRLSQNGRSGGRVVHSASRPVISKNEDISRSAEERTYDLFINQEFAQCNGIDTVSNSSISPESALGNWTPQVIVTLHTVPWKRALGITSASQGSVRFGY